MATVAGEAVVFKVGSTSTCTQIAVNSIDYDGISNDLVDTFGLGDTVKTQRVSKIKDLGSLKIEIRRDSASANHTLLWTAANDGSTVYFEIVYPNADKHTGHGVVSKFGFSGMDSGSPNDQVSSVEIKVNELTFVAD